MGFHIAFQERYYGFGYIPHLWLLLVHCQMQHLPCCPGLAVCCSICSGLFCPSEEQGNIRKKLPLKVLHNIGNSLQMLWISLFVKLSTQRHNCVYLKIDRHNRLSTAWVQLTQSLYQRLLMWYSGLPVRQSQSSNLFSLVQSKGKRKKGSLAVICESW